MLGKHYLCAVVKDAANWPTPAARDHHAQGANHNQAAQSSSLATVLEKHGQAAPASSNTSGSRQGLWPTASVPNGGQTTSGRADKDTKKQVRLEHAVRQELWLTPRANEPDSDPNFAARNADRGAHCHGTLSSQAKAEQWPTPEASQGGRQGGSFSQKSWMRQDGTPRQMSLAQATKQWATPNACDHKGATSLEACKKWEHRGQNLPEMVVGNWATPRTPTGGPETAKRKQELGRTASGGGDLASQANGKLNQAWVCCLMGVPMGWVDPMCPVSVIKNWPRFVIGWLRAQTAQIPSGFSAMELCQPPQSELSEFSLAS
jgi:hypothetical protein